mgnify:CR=1 FL=1
MGLKSALLQRGANLVDKLKRLCYNMSEGNKKPPKECFFFGDIILFHCITISIRQVTKHPSAETEHLSANTKQGLVGLSELICYAE